MVIDLILEISEKLLEN